jgi:uncharacterized protein YkwD
VALPIWLVLAALLAPQVNAPQASAQGDLGMAVAQRVNQARDNRGIDRLDVRGHLNDVALDQAQRMARRGVLFHNPNLAGDMVGDWQWVGENVGYGPDVKTVHAAFMRSPLHRAQHRGPRLHQTRHGSGSPRHPRLGGPRVPRQVAPTVSGREADTEPAATMVVST